MEIIWMTWNRILPLRNGRIRTKFQSRLKFPTTRRSPNLLDSTKSHHLCTQELKTQTWITASSDFQREMAQFIRALTSSLTVPFQSTESAQMVEPSLPHKWQLTKDEWELLKQAMVANISSQSSITSLKNPTLCQASAVIWLSIPNHTTLERATSLRC